MHAPLAPSSAVAPTDRRAAHLLRGAIAVVAIIALVALPTSLLPLAALVLMATWARTDLRRWLAALTWTLPFHIVAMAMLFGYYGMPGNTVRAIAAWKEMFVLVVMAVVIARAVHGSTTRGERAGVCWQDAAIGGFLLLAIIYLIAGSLLMPAAQTAVGLLYGLRDAAFFTLLYFAGRSAPEIGGDDTVLRRLLVVGALTGAIAIIERVVVTPELLVLLGAASYFNDFLGVAAFTQANAFGLPDNYWTMIAGRTVQRAGSVYLSSQGFAVPFLLLIPAATVWLMTRGKRAPLIAWMGYAMMWAGLLLTLARMTIIACVLQLVLFAALRRRLSLVGWLLVCGLIVVLGAIAMMPGFAGFLVETITWQSSSSGTHLADWGRGVAAILERPLGTGLGTADQTAVRSGLTPLTADNQYLKLAVELGVPGMLLHVIGLLGLGAAATRLYVTRRDDAAGRLGLVIVLATVGIALNAMTTVLYNSMVLAYLYFWLAGATVTLACQRPSAARA
jgi:hypothetical protein